MGRPEFFPLTELQKISWFNSRATNSVRAFTSTSFYVQGKWHLWIAVNGELRKFIGEPVDARYFGDAPARSTDQFFEVTNLIVQHLMTSEMFRCFTGFENDVQCLAASLAKFSLFFAAHRNGVPASRFVQTESEYIIIVCRGMFDLLQELVSLIFKNATHNGTRMKQLPDDSFARIAINDKVRRTSAEIEQKYGLPTPIAQWYERHSEFFQILRDLRNKMAHGGSVAVDMVFCTDHGFAIPRSFRPYSWFYQWPTGIDLPNELVPLMPVLCSIIKRTFHACDDFARILAGHVQLPAEVFPGLRYFARGVYDAHLAAIDGVLANSSWHVIAP